MKPYILLLDDDIEDIAVLQVYLQKEGITEAICFNDAFKALEYLKYQATTLPSLIVTDGRLPTMTGIEFAEQVREQPDLRSIPIAVLSGYVSEKEKQALLRSGVFDVYLKPATLEGLENIVKKLLLSINITNASN